MGEMRILTVRQPYAWAIIHGGKNVENRVRNIAGGYRGPVAIHAAKVNDLEAWRAMGRTDLGAYTRALEARESLIGGAIIGVVDLVDVHSASVIDGCGVMLHDCPEHGTCRNHCSTWALGPTPDGWYQHLVFADPRPLDTPIPYKGALGLRRLDTETVARVLAQIGETK